ncbi:MAG: hypothetical protein K0M40_05255 [Prolixibacteraceae bacterium]|nr:hypothetical protein [Prolixibacteraceae bacterium]
METNDKQVSRNIENFEEKKESKILTFVKKHWFVFLLIVVIIVLLLWAVIKIQIVEKRSVKEKEQLVNLYELRMDSLHLSNMELTSKVFSWAIRSEMTRQNMEQVNQFFSGFVKEPNVKKVLLIDPVSAKVLLSSDKKDEGMFFENTLVLKAEKTYHFSDDTVDTIISPVMGLDTRIGVLVIELEKN